MKVKNYTVQRGTREVKVYEGLTFAGSDCTDLETGMVIICFEIGEKKELELHLPVDDAERLMNDLPDSIKYTRRSEDDQ